MKRSFTTTLFALAAATVFSATLFHSEGLASWALVGLAVVTAVAALGRQSQILHVTLLFLLVASFGRLAPAALQLWPFRLLLPLLLYLGIAFAVPGLRRSVAWAKLGRFDTRLLVLVLGTILASGVALAGWVVLAAPDLNRYTQSLPDVPGWVIPLVGLGFALLNAAMEEVSFRGVVMEGFENALGPGKAALILQALLFGFLHYRAGFPNGAWGVAMTFVFGLMLGALRRLSGGLLVPWVAHVGADAVIFALVIRFVLARA